MKIEPNSDIGMNAVTVLIHHGSIEFQDGTIMAADELQKPDNQFNALCKSIDPNVTYINVLIPDHLDDNLYFQLRDMGNASSVHVQSIAQREQEIWQIWEYHKQLNNNSIEP